jgi:hypothetical protein
MHAKKTFEEMKKKDPKATYTDALKKASSTFKKVDLTSGKVDSGKVMPMRKRSDSMS